MLTGTTGLLSQLLAEPVLVIRWQLVVDVFFLQQVVGQVEEDMLHGWLREVPVEVLVCDLKIGPIPSGGDKAEATKRPWNFVRRVWNKGFVAVVAVSASTFFTKLMEVFDQERRAPRPLFGATS